VTLAKHLGINISAIRSHLDVLELAGLVSSRREPATRGRPKRIYALTPLALTLFPQKSVQLISTILQAMERSLDAKTVNALIQQTAQSLWQQILPEKPSGSLRDQLAYIVQALNRAGSYASLEEDEDAFVIVIRNFIFREALNIVSPAMGSYFTTEFLRELRRMLGPVRVHWADTPELGNHLRRIRVKPRRERT
jgi:predicted ArsR family transcriptional regulator